MNHLNRLHAGSDSIGFDDGRGMPVRFALIENLVIDEQGNLIAVDANNSRISKISY